MSSMASGTENQIPEAHLLPNSLVNHTQLDFASSSSDPTSEKLKNDALETSEAVNDLNNLSTTSNSTPISQMNSPENLSVDELSINEKIGSSLSHGSALDAQLGVESKGAIEGLQIGREERKSKKLDRPFAAKCKSGKRSTKNERDILDFTLKYQHIVDERDAAIAVRGKLESLCRELLRQNKTLTEECQRVSTEGIDLREDISTKFHDVIEGVNRKLEAQQKECVSQLRENEMLREMVKNLHDDYAATKGQYEEMLKQKIVELERANLMLQQSEKKTAQKQAQVEQYAYEIPRLLETERNLRSQLAADTEKFQQFEDALLKSNDVFETSRKEMDKLGKTIKELRKENSFLKEKCMKSDISLIELAEERELLKKELAKVKNQKEKLESLCRSLQAERKHTHTEIA